MSTITIDTGDGLMNAYLALPPGGHGPGIVLIQEIFGINEVMRDLADGLATQGYVVACPDLFWRIEPGIDISDKTEAEWARAFDLFKTFHVEHGVRDLRATLAALRAHSAVTGKVGAVGYCLGGKLAYLMAARTDVDCAVGYYGVGLQDMLSEASQIRKPLMLHIAGRDEFTPPAAQAKVHAALDAHPHITIHDFPSNNHAFARVGGAHYDADEALIANGLTHEFFKRHLS
ncbi:MAG TPA: dienelactone hydrolase family protein [Aliidongia sp.]|uniref:dienelactone hydrolase family protein n=1 Tax=Aliidongia sp. TaxID=1914230 RepID=UPI002DDD994E|nr:dienelactone hydrolase family protein [Aliidongia sp.]HEV2676869.1 dienelactone hydrolase family protein [Aliidongia sp.]